MKSSVKVSSQYNLLICLYVAFFLIISISSEKIETRLKAKLKSKVNTRKSEGLMELLTDFFSTIETKNEISKNVNTNSANKNKNINSNEYGDKVFNFLSTNINPPNKPIDSTQSNLNQNAQSLSRIFNKSNNTNQIKNSNSDNNVDFNPEKDLWNTHQDEENMDIRLEGWLKVSSTKFTESEEFPPVILPDGTTLRMSLDKNNFLINPSLSSINEKIKQEGAGKIKQNYFYFRLSKLNLYFTINSYEHHILSALNLKSIKEVQAFNDYGKDGMCFQITDSEKKDWKLCAIDIDQKNKWICTMEEIVGFNSMRCYKKEIDNTQNIIEVTINKPIIMVPLPSRHCNENWGYSNNGAEWECECRESKEQSPIDLPIARDSIESIVRPVFQYLMVDAKASVTSLDKMMKEGENIKIIFKDNLLRILHSDLGRVISTDGTVYQAEEIQFHTPAEHTIGNKKFDMEMQIIHYGITKGDLGKQFILCLLFEAKAGMYNLFLNDLDFFNLPNKISKETDIINDLFIPRAFYTATDTGKPEEVKYMKQFSFYTYQGSLTAPPCNDNTIVVVSAEIQQMSISSLNLFREAIAPKYYQDNNGNINFEEGVTTNNRNVQDKNGRPVFYFDCDKNCPKDPAPIRRAPTGHFEKGRKKVKQYFYVAGYDPSGIPDSFVVNSNEVNKTPSNYGNE